LNARDADTLLQQLSTASKMGQSAAEIYRQAIRDERNAQQLAEQAAAAKAERQRLADVAQAAATAAQTAAQAADNAYAEQAAHQDELYAQLAALKDTTADLERERAAGIAAQLAAEAAARLAQSGSGSSGSTSNPPPASGSVETAISFAMAQLGEPYVLGGAGPDSWDCSGLTLMSYRAAGISIGTHSATNQYYTLAGRGLAVSLSNIQRGDLLFWGSGGDYYHVAIYLGNGQIIEAPSYGKPVRIWYIWGTPSAAARPAG
ncbi:MAG: C40 family peptidase, partial [Agromyces sp.]